MKYQLVAIKLDEGCLFINHYLCFLRQSVSQPLPQSRRRGEETRLRENKQEYQQMEILMPKQWVVFTERIFVLQMDRQQNVKSLSLRRLLSLFSSFHGKKVRRHT
jgi:hypothetical protein